MSLISLVRSNNIDGVGKLLEIENVNLQNKNGVIALLWASKKGNIEIVKLLLGKGVIVPSTSFYTSDSNDINNVLTNWKTYLPRWNRFKTYKYYPKEFKEIAIQWLLICKRKNFVSKDIRLLMIEYLAESWKILN